MTDIRIVKQDASEDQHMIWAEVYAPNRPDSDNEFMVADTIKKMAYDFIREHKTKMIDVRHNNRTVPGVELVESFIARKGDPDFIEGAWVIGVHVPDEGIWQAIKSGEINGFSVEALVNRAEKEVEIEMPDVISGTTSVSKSSDAQDHSHEFYVTYDLDTGNLRGGVTNMANGHMHIIKNGTVTDEADGHRHRFSSVDLINIVS